MALMIIETENQREGKGKGEYIQWRPEESKMLIELAADCVTQGLVDPNGRMFKKTVETHILSVLNKTFKCNKTYKHYVNRMKILKNQYRDFVHLLRFSSKFEWNPITKKFTAPDEVWNAFFRDNPNHRHMRYETYEEYEHMNIVFGNSNAMRRLESTHSQPCEVGNNEKPKQEMDLINDAEEVHVSMEGRHGTSLYLENSVESPLLDQEDRTDDLSVTEKDILKEVCAELRSIDSATKQMFHVMQGRSMVEKRKTNVWDAIQEIPNLSNNTRYKALTMILKLGMRDVFVNMSIEDRLGWILCSL